MDELKKLICEIRRKYNVRVYLEPGEAIALNAGYLVTEVMDIVHNGMDILILDASAACHMPDVLEMPYRPPLKDGYLPGEKPHTYRLSSMTCLAGDVIGDYSFAQKNRWETVWSLRIWQFIPWSKTIHLTGCRCPELQSYGKMEMSR